MLRADALQPRAPLQNWHWFGDTTKVHAFIGQRWGPFLSEMQAGEFYPAQSWPCFSSAPSFRWLSLAWRLGPECSGRPHLSGSHCPRMPVPYAQRYSCTPFPECTLCPPVSMSFLTLFCLPFTLITHTLLDTIHMPNATSSKEPSMTAMPQIL